MHTLAENEKERKTLQEKEGIHLIIHSMKTHMNHPRLQTAAFHALVTALRPYGGVEGQVFREEIVPQLSDPALLHLPELILQAMEQYPQDSHLQTMACWALVNVSLVPELNANIAQSDGLKWIVKALHQHSQNSQVVSRAALAFVNLMDSHKHLYTMIRDTIPLLVEVLHFHIHDFSIVTRIVAIFRNFVLHEGNQQQSRMQFHLIQNSSQVLVDRYPQEKIFQIICTDLIREVSGQTPSHP